jgi:carbonic anhydrase
MHIHTDACQHAAPKLGRRNFVKLMSLGAGASIISISSPLRANGKAKAIMLSCMDYRLPDETVALMNKNGLENEYDHIVLAGASLGVVADQLKEWRPAFWDQVGLAVKLHGIEEVIVVDHRDCGAYKLVLGADAVATPELELAVHTETLKAFAAQVREKHPELAVQAYLLALDGTAETIDVAA